MNRTLICVVCPRGCEINVEYNEKTKDLLSMTGQGCRRGEQYAKNECFTPVRTLTTTMRISCGGLIPVRTDKPVPRGVLFDCMAEINKTQAPVGAKIGDVIIKNILGTGANVIASGNKT